MTFKEKLQKEHPEKIDARYAGGCAGCPHSYEYGKGLCGGCGWDRVLCEKCWNREIPEEKPKKRSQHQQVADFLWNMYVAFKEAGFEADKAFDLTKVAYEVIVEEYHHRS